MLRINVKQSFGSFEVDVAFSIPSKGITALFGPSGAGKSSVINMIAGLKKPDMGSIVFNNALLFDSKDKVYLPPEKRRIGYIFQEARLFPHLTVKANLTYGMRLVPKGKRYVAFDEVVSLLGIKHLLSRRPEKLSGGEKQRIAIGRAFLTSPELLLMDEPLSSLDYSRKAEILPFIGKLSRKFSIPVLYVSHSFEEIMTIADHLVLLKGGKVVASGTITDLMSQVELFRCFRGNDYGAVLSTKVKVSDDGLGLTCLGFGDDVVFKIPKFKTVTGSVVRIHISALEVALALDEPSNISTQNIFPGEIKKIVEYEEGYVDVKIDAGYSLISRVTKRSKQMLDLHVGQKVYCLVKSVSILRGIN